MKRVEAVIMQDKLDSIVDKVISAILDTASTGSVGDSKIFVDTIDTAVDIGSRQKGVHAI